STGTRSIATWSATATPTARRTDTRPRHASRSPSRNATTAIPITTRPVAAAAVGESRSRRSPRATAARGAAAPPPGGEGGTNGDRGIAATTAISRTAATVPRAASRPDGAGRDRRWFTSADCSSGLEPGSRPAKASARWADDLEVGERVDGAVRPGDDSVVRRDVVRVPLEVVVRRRRLGVARVPNEPDDGSRPHVPGGDPVLHQVRHVDVALRALDRDGVAAER